MATRHRPFSAATQSPHHARHHWSPRRFASGFIPADVAHPPRMTATSATTPSTGTTPGRRVTRFLERAPSPVFVSYSILAAFTTYFCMYAFRKPFAAARFDGEVLMLFGRAVELKTAIVVSQILGYATSKYIGIKVCSEVKSGRRAFALVALIVLAELALVLYGILPNHLKVIAIFLNGLPLGMVWGLIVWYLEGRRTSELLLAGLSCSYIVSSGVVKNIGLAVLAGDAANWWSHVPLLGPLIGGG